MPRPNDNFVFDAIGTRWWCEALDGTISRSLQADLVAFADAFDILSARAAAFLSLPAERRAARHLAAELNRIGKI